MSPKVCASHGSATDRPGFALQSLSALDLPLEPHQKRQHLSELNGALSKHLLITGRDKRVALEQAMSLPPEDAPVQAILGETTVHWAE